MKANFKLNKFLKFNFISFLVFLVWPFFALIFSVVNLRKKASPYILWLFCGFFGYSFIISNDLLDSSRYSSQLASLHNSNLSLLGFISLLIEGNYGRGDFYQPILTFLVSRITDDYRILSMFFGLVFGYFYVKNIYFLISRSGSSIKNLAMPILILFIFIVPIWNINGVRFYTACHIFIYAMLHILINKRYKYIFLAVISALVHFSFILPLLVLLTYLVFGFRFWIVMFLFFLSILFQNVNVFEIINRIPSLGSILDARLLAYTHPDYVDYVNKGNANKVWFLVWSNYAIKTISYLSIIILALNFKFLKQKKIAKLFLFGVAFFAVSNFVSQIPSMGRFYSLSFLLLNGALFLYIQQRKNLYWIKRVMLIFTPLIIFFIVIQVRFGMSVFGPVLFLSNFMIQPFLSEMPSFYN